MHVHKVFQLIETNLNLVLKFLFACLLACLHSLSDFAHEL